MRGLSSVLALLSLNACYVYVPAGDSAPEPGTEIRAHLAPARDFEVGTITVRDVSRVDGIVYGASAESVAVWSSWLYSAVGNRFASQSAVYYLPHDQVARLEERKLHPARSVVGIGVSLGLGAALFNFVADAGADPGPVGKGGPVQLQIARPFR